MLNIVDFIAGTEIVARDKVWLTVIVLSKNDRFGLYIKETSTYLQSLKEKENIKNLKYEHFTFKVFSHAAIFESHSHPFSAIFANKKCQNYSNSKFNFSCFSFVLFPTFSPFPRPSFPIFLYLNFLRVKLCFIGLQWIIK